MSTRAAHVKKAAKSSYWRARFGTWPRKSPRTEGYTLLVPVPGDLPVFLELALAVCKLQAAEHRVETLVLPDVMTDTVRAVVERASTDWPGDLGLSQAPRPERWLLPRLNDPGRNHGVQLITGVTDSRATHVVLHDADLFLLAEDLHDRNYELCVERGLDVLGVEGAWDPWYGRHGRELAATWEQTASVDWLRSFPPHRHLGHDARLWGERHTFDTTFWAQCHTPAERIAVTGESRSIIHFNYVISTYRRFQREGARNFDDNQFRLLLIRLFIDVFGERSGDYALPSMEELAHGLGREDARVRYRSRWDSTYHGFRTKVEGILSGPWTATERADDVRRALAPFDAFYAGTPTGSDDPPSRRCS